MMPLEVIENCGKPIYTVEMVPFVGIGGQHWPWITHPPTSFFLPMDCRGLFCYPRVPTAKPPVVRRNNFNRYHFRFVSGHEKYT